MGGRPPRVTATAAKSTKRSRARKTRGQSWPERRRWDFDRPLASASQAAGRTNESSKERVPVLARPRRRSTSTLCAARVRRASKRHSWSPSFAWYAIPNPSQGRICNRIGLDLERASGSSNVTRKYRLQKKISP